MSPYIERTYRKHVSAEDLVSFPVAIKETDLRVSAERNLEKETIDLVLNYRKHLEDYIKVHSGFISILTPFPEDPFAPPIVREMILTTRDIGVGPMASVAGAIAQYVGRDLLELTGQVIVENGGDIYLACTRPSTVSIFAGDSPLSHRIGLRIPVENMPLGICTSSSTIGHSLSMGIADAVCILSPSAILADGAATALCNRIKDLKDLNQIADWAAEIEGIIGGMAILGDRMATWGDLELVSL